MGKRGPSCTVCQHREHAAIDVALSRGVSGRAIAGRYRLGHDAVLRHARNHLPAQLRAKLLAGPDLEIDVSKLRETESQSLLMHLVALRGRLLHTMDVAEECGDGMMVSKLAGAIHKNLELTGRLLGDLAVGSTSTTNILIAPQYIELRAALWKALSSFPEARTAVAAAIHRLEDKAAEQVRTETRELAGATRQPVTIDAIALPLPPVPVP